MKNKHADKIAKLLAAQQELEDSLVIKKNKNLAKNLRRLLSIKRKLVIINNSKSLDDPL